MTPLPDVGARVRFRARSEAVIRAFFARTDALEVATPIAVPSPGMEPHLHAFALPSQMCRDWGARWLHTSPEYAIKATLAAIDADVFTLARSFRDEPISRWHHPEFTMLEWYRLRSDHRRLMDDCEVLIGALLDAHGVHDVARGPWRRLSWRDAFAAYAPGFDAFVDDAPTLVAAARALGVDVGDDWDVATVTTVVYATRIEPHLGVPDPVFLTEFPATQAALARISPSDPSVAERFELYVPGRDLADGGAHGVELANAFSELTDPDEQRARFDAERAWRQANGLDAYPVPGALLDGIGSLPPTAGIALGVERLLVWLAEVAHGWQTGVSDWLLAEPLAGAWRDGLPG